MWQILREARGGSNPKERIGAIWTNGSEEEDEGKGKVKSTRGRR
jgi:hypothetical protein